MAFGDGIKRLLSGKPKPAKKAATTKTKPSNTVLAPSQRKELIEWAVHIHRAKAPTARGMLDQALKGFRAKPPNLRDPDALARMLRITRAETDLRRIMNHREWRYLILAGLRQLLHEAQNEPAGRAESKPAPAKQSRRTVIRR